jgi:hypothetical protein
MQRWGLNERNLPAGSIVLNREPTFWEGYRRYIVSGTLFVSWRRRRLLLPSYGNGREGRKRKRP